MTFKAGYKICSFADMAVSERNGGAAARRAGAVTCGALEGGRHAIEDPHPLRQRAGKFAGIAERVTAGYFDDLGVTALSLMPLAEVPTKQGPSALGYDPSLFCTVERLRHAGRP